MAGILFGCLSTHLRRAWRFHRTATLSLGFPTPWFPPPPPASPPTRPSASHLLAAAARARPPRPMHVLWWVESTLGGCRHARPPSSAERSAGASNVRTRTPPAPFLPRQADAPSPRADEEGERDARLATARREETLQGVPPWREAHVHVSSGWHGVTLPSGLVRKRSWKEETCAKRRQRGGWKREREVSLARRRATRCSCNDDASYMCFEQRGRTRRRSPMQTNDGEAKHRGIFRIESSVDGTNVNASSSIRKHEKVAWKS